MQHLTGEIKRRIIEKLDLGKLDAPVVPGVVLINAVPGLATVLSCDGERRNDGLAYVAFRTDMRMYTRLQNNAVWVLRVEGVARLELAFWLEKSDVTPCFYVWLDPVTLPWSLCDVAYALNDLWGLEYDCA